MAKLASKTFLLIFGPPAVGKMTVGQELEKLTGLKLFHNHMIIDPLISIFGDRRHNLKKIIFEIRSIIFKEVVQSNLPGLIFTFVWNFDKKCNSIQSVDSWVKIFNEANWKVYCVEMLADLETRLVRNKTNNRIMHKQSKQNIYQSEKILLDNEKNWQMQSEKDFRYGHKFLRIQNSHDKSALEIAKQIQIFFKI